MSEPSELYEWTVFKSQSNGFLRAFFLIAIQIHKFSQQFSELSKKQEKFYSIHLKSFQNPRDPIIVRHPLKSVLG